jgi:hypothetical protein
VAVASEGGPGGRHRLVHGDQRVELDDPHHRRQPGVGGHDDVELATGGGQPIGDQEQAPYRTAVEVAQTGQVDHQPRAPGGQVDQAVLDPGRGGGVDLARQANDLHPADLDLLEDHHLLGRLGRVGPADDRPA